MTGESPQRITGPVLVLDDVTPHSVGLIDISLTGVVTLNISAGWNMIALPGLPTNLDPQSLGPDSQTLLQPFYYWKPDSFSYKPVTQLDFGQGYWILSINPDGETITLPVELTSSYTVSLKAGWNMIGSVSQVVDFSNPADNPDQSILPGTLYEWKADAYTYQPTTLIEPGGGYWVLTLNDCQLTVGGGVN